MTCRYSRSADRRRCHRQDNPLPRPSEDDLLKMYASRTVESISRELGHNHNTVKSWITRAIHRDEYNPRSRAQFNARRLREELRT